MKWNIQALEDQQNTIQDTSQEYYGSTASSYFPEPIQKLIEWTSCSYCGRRNVEDVTDDPICLGCGAPL